MSEDSLGERIARIEEAQTYIGRDISALSARMQSDLTAIFTKLNSLMESNSENQIKSSADRLEIKASIKDINSRQDQTDQDIKELKKQIEDMNITKQRLIGARIAITAIWVAVGGLIVFFAPYLFRFFTASKP
ncbi:MAG: hypothetical protein U5K75_10630 [Ahrensia sp.]|nr:hypothetical protein [Ahrensia sp.]